MADKKAVKNVMMVALKPGFYKKRIREGEVFEYTGVPGKWMAPMGKAAKVEKAVKENKSPETFSGMQKAMIDAEKKNEA